MFESVVFITPSTSNQISYIYTYTHVSIYQHPSTQISLPILIIRYSTVLETENKVGINGGGRFRRTEMAVRVLALVLTLAAAVVLGVNKQSTTVPVTIVASLPPVNMPVTAKWVHMSAFVYFVIANAIACAYTTISLIPTLASKGGTKKVSIMVTTLDLVVVALLFSAIGASGSVGLVGYKGNSHVQWQKVCNVFDKFCHQVAAAMALSFIASLAYLLLVVLAIFNVYNKL